VLHRLDDCLLRNSINAFITLLEGGRVGEDETRNSTERRRSPTRPRDAGTGRDRPDVSERVCQRAPLDLSFISDAWWPLVTGLKTRSAVSQIDRRLFELCVVTQVANDLKSGDLCIPEVDKFRDYRYQLLSWEKVERSN
jgi:hypothetical protein